MELNKLRDRAYKCAVEHGFHEKELSNEHCLWLVVTELSEATESDRKGKHADVDTFKYIIEDDLRERHLYGKEYEASFIDNFKEYIKDSVEDELADACIRLFDLAGLRDIELDDYNYSESDTENYSCLTFTESMFYISEKTVRSWCNDFDLELSIPEILNDIFCFCKSRKIDIMFHIEQKMKYNETRPYKHGKQY